MGSECVMYAQRACVCVCVCGSQICQWVATHTYTRLHIPNIHTHTLTRIAKWDIWSKKQTIAVFHCWPHIPVEEWSWPYYPTWIPHQKADLFILSGLRYFPGTLSFGHEHAGTSYKTCCISYHVFFYIQLKSFKCYFSCLSLYVFVCTEWTQRLIPYVGRKVWCKRCKREEKCHHVGRISFSAWDVKLCFLFWSGHLNSIAGYRHDGSQKWTRKAVHFKYVEFKLNQVWIPSVRN